MPTTAIVSPQEKPVPTLLSRCQETSGERSIDRRPDQTSAPSGSDGREWPSPVSDYDAKNTRTSRSKVPDATISFWFTKILTTGMGEITSDFLLRTFDPPLVIGVSAFGLAASLVLQFTVRRYNPFIYWFAVVMVSLFGTMIADIIHFALHVPLVVTTIAFSSTLALIFAIWYYCERELSIHSITSTRREAFYWGVVLATFVLGTSAGDMTAQTLGLGFLASGVMFAVAFALPGLLFWRFRLNAVFAFWLAYILTRPLGASFADWMVAGPDRGGLSLGGGAVSLALTCMIVLMVSSLSVFE